MDIDNRKKQIIALWREKATGGEIAAQLGITRNAVMGHLHRMRAAGLLEPRSKPVETKKPKSKAKPAKRAKIRPTAKSSAGKSRLREHAPKPSSLPQLPGLPHHVQLDGLRLMSCRYIVCESPTGPFYCGDPKVKGSYCATHAALCYLPARDRKSAQRRINHYTAQMARL